MGVSGTVRPLARLFPDDGKRHELIQGDHYLTRCAARPALKAGEDVKLSGNPGDDAKQYQIRAVRLTIEEAAR